MADTKLFQYYERQEILPTFGDLKSLDELQRYVAQRRELFVDKLMLPLRLFRNAEILEFGPDSGENAIVFSGWGASMTLAEPNKQAHPKITSYFERYGLTSRLRELVSTDVEGFHSDRRFDVVDAEGFIYTVQPTEAWLRVFSRVLNPDGFAIVSYYERYGGFIELALKAIHAAGKALTGLPPKDSAQMLFDAKWNSVPHTRSFDSWLMDVLENPFVRYRYFIDAATLCRAADATGFDIHSAWPSYRDALDVYWHKKVKSRNEILDGTVDHIHRSRLSFLSGQKLYLVGNAQSVDYISALAEHLVQNIDALIDDPLGDRLTQLLTNLASFRQAIEKTEIFAKNAAAMKALTDLIAAVQRIFAAVAERDVNGMVALTRSDPAFIKAWGQPAHFLVMRKRLEDLTAAQHCR